MRNIPIVTKNLLIINVVAFLATMLMKTGGVDLNSMFGLHFFMASDFQIWQLFTYMFLHAGFTHILFNMFALWMFGVVIENVWGPKKFLFYYISCGVGAGLMQELAQFVSFYFMISAQDPTIGVAQMFEVGRQLSNELNMWTTIGASGAVYSILLAFGMIFPNERIFIFPLPIPIKAKWFVMIYVAIELFSAIGTPGDNVAHMAHLGGMLFGFLMIRYWNKHPNGGGQYGRNRGEEFFKNLKRNFDRRKGNTHGNYADMHVHQGGGRQSDWEYNEMKKKKQQEVDRILDKIRRSGYDSLTADEKKTLFDSSQER